MADLPPYKTSPDLHPVSELFAGEVAPLPAELKPGQPPITPAEGAWAALIVLGMQNLISALATRVFHLPLGVSLLLAFLSTVIVFGLTMRRTALALFQDLRWRTRPNWGVMFGAFGLGFVASRALLLFVLSLWPQGAQTVPEFASKGYDMWVLLLVAGFLIPVAEEIAFRGLLLRGLEWVRGPIFAAVVSSLLFGFAHGAPAQVIAILPLAWLLARSVQYSGSLWTSVGVHILNNALAVGLGALLQGRDMNALTGDLASTTIPLSLGLAALLIGVAALVVGTLWLTPRTSPAPALRFPSWPVWTASTLVLVVLVLAVVGLATVPIFFPELNVKGL
ncbi:CPBP family intramembrane metalloprotease [Deinococcus psychrotolerans]|uniref:CPBP family intramembrane metalloprotease n=1 Tax=Deinococcus psychrotolerans TaxID=2489213 RepID=A0A3G8YE59_9DEIO|nr:type II CAAX endopeptidase family protein [Deinococcus psychrotolerans]AZI43223.1 CPBP family intramembrane metalloprotease [Deinococcus psychrotolerans]